MKGLRTVLDVKVGALKARAKQARSAIQEEKWAGWSPEKLKVVRRLVDALEASEAVATEYQKEK